MPIPSVPPGQPLPGQPPQAAPTGYPTQQPYPDHQGGPFAQPQQAPHYPDPAPEAAHEPASPWGTEPEQPPEADTDGEGYTTTLPEAAIEAAQELLRALADDESSEVIINGPNEALVKVRGQRFHVPAVAFQDAATYHQAINEFVLPYVDTADRIDESGNILIEGQMELPSHDPSEPPMLARVHILCPPLVSFAKVTIAKKARYEFDLDAIASSGAMSPEMAAFLKAVSHGRLTFVVSGPTGAGKTTLLQAMARDFDQNDRIIVIEDTPELRLPLADVVYLCSTAVKPGVKPEESVSTEFLVKASNRMRMDRVIVGECRGAEMAEWLIAANSGAEGSATTVHADNPRRALEKILGLATKSVSAGSEMTLRREIAATIDVVVQAGLIDGRHVITQIEEITSVTEKGVMATQTLFAYNRGTGRHEPVTRASDDLVATLRTRGASIDPRWWG